MNSSRANARISAAVESSEILPKVRRISRQRDNTRCRCRKKSRDKSGALRCGDATLAVGASTCFAKHLSVGRSITAYDVDGKIVDGFGEKSKFYRFFRRCHQF